MFKKTLVLALWVVAVVSSLAMANYSTSPERVTKTSYAFNFKATYTNWVVKTSWNKFVLPAWYSWTYMKLVKSQKNSSPVYPDDGYVMYDGNMGVTSWTHNDPSEGKNYYRVCAITSKGEYKVRRCSNVVAVNVWSPSNDDNTVEEDATVDTTPTVKPTPVVADKYAKLYPLVDKLVENFMAKLEAKYPGNPDSQKTLLEALIAKVSTLTAKSPLFVYLNDKLEEQLQILNLSSLLNVN